MPVSVYGTSSAISQPSSAGRHAPYVWFALHRLIAATHAGVAATISAWTTLPTAALWPFVETAMSL